MGWRERDYGRFNDDERRALFGGGRGRALPPSDEVRAYRPAPLQSRRPVGTRKRSSSSPATLLAVAVSGAAIIFGGYVANVPGVRSILDQRTHSPLFAQQPAMQPVATVNVVWRPADLIPAAHAGRLCLAAGAHGRICASYVAGERPADNLAREIKRRGLSVRSSG